MHLIAEIGINHNGDINIAKTLMTLSKQIGFNYVKIQKRNPDICVPEEQKNTPKQTPWGEMTYLAYKKRIEFSETQIKELTDFSKKIGITFFSSVWDKDSVDVMKKYSPIGKIPSAMITDLDLCKYARDAFSTLIVSTGMSTEEQIEQCVDACKPDIIMHSNSTYPSPIDELNLNYIRWLIEKYPDKQIGYSGHESGIITTVAATVLGATYIERHVTLDKNMWGSDQKSSLDPSDMKELIECINEVKAATKYPPRPRLVLESERSKMQSLRK